MFGFGVDLMPGQMLGQVHARHVAVAFRTVAGIDGHDADLLGQLQQRQGIIDGACCPSAAVPGHHHPFADHRVLAHIGYDQGRTPHGQNQAIRQSGIGGDTAFFRVELADHRKIAVAGIHVENFDYIAFGRAPFKGHIGFLGFIDEDRFRFVGQPIQRSRLHIQHVLADLGLDIRRNGDVGFDIEPGQVRPMGDS